MVARSINDKEKTLSAVFFSLFQMNNNAAHCFSIVLALTRPSIKYKQDVLFTAVSIVLLRKDNINGFRSLDILFYNHGK